MSFPDQTTLEEGGKPISIIEVEQVTDLPADLLKQTKELDIRGDRVIVLDHRHPPLVARQVELLNGLLAFLTEKRWGDEPLQCEWTVIQAHKYEGKSSASGMLYEPKNMAMRVTVEAQLRTGERITFDRRPPTPPSAEKEDVPSTGNGIIKYQAPQPTSLNQIRHQC